MKPVSGFLIVLLLLPCHQSAIAAQPEDEVFNCAATTTGNLTAVRSQKRQQFVGMEDLHAFAQKELLVVESPAKRRIGLVHA